VPNDWAPTDHYLQVDSDSKGQTVPSPDGDPEAGRGVPRWLAWLGVVPVAWLIVVAYGYSLVALYPFAATRAEVPGLSVVDQAILPLLACLVAVAIIRYICILRPALDPGRSKPAAPLPDDSRNTLPPARD
jgi:hypothetical protein